MVYRSKVIGHRARVEQFVLVLAGSHCGHPVIMKQEVLRLRGWLPLEVLHLHHRFLTQCEDKLIKLHTLSLSTVQISERHC